MRPGHIDAFSWRTTGPLSNNVSLDKRSAGPEIEDGGIVTTRRLVGTDSHIPIYKHYLRFVDHSLTEPGWAHLYDWRDA